MNKKYEELTEEFIHALEAVDGSLADFVEGLEYAANEVRDRWQSAQAELSTIEKEESDA